MPQKGFVQVGKELDGFMQTREFFLHFLIILLGLLKHHFQLAIEVCHGLLRMSLYIGQISARTHRDDLERVFRRYGQCDVRLKDGYGFVVYDFPLNAEKALRGLQGKSIFGQQLTITWSKKQPRAFQRYTRGARSYESHGRDFGRRKGPNDWGNYSSGNRQTDGDGDRLNSEDMLAEGRDYHQEETIDCVGEEHDNFREDLRRDGDDYLGEEQDNYRENFARDGGDYIRERDNFREDLARDGGGTVSKIDNGRWGERVDDHSNENGLYSDLNTDRYEPYQGYDRRDKDENRWKTRSGGRGDGELERFESKSGNNVQPSKGAKLREMNDKRGDGELERFESKSGHIVQPCKGAELRKMNDKWTSNSEKHQVSVKNRNSDEVVRVQGKDSERKKRNKRETGSPKIQSAKKPKRSASTTFDSEYPASRARSSIKGDTHCENAQTEIGMTVLKNGNAVSASEVENDTEKNQDTTKSRSLFKMTSLGNSQSDVGAGHSTPDDLKVTSDQTNSDALATNRILKPTDASDSGTPTVSSGRSTNISLNEMCMVLKHYGLEVPEESERHHSLESYFGSARLWPWQSIYYRRMRKGPVSVENYAKRVAQNQEFGIVDKYIRSSSGWGEMYQENP
ncbi:hypothetical protein F8388_004916 [Cannabis sativa]|uniref:RRM domain-containing protein n=1 Tax=Cannabis sativa TaxID=3483 RepID=A0A7J6HQE0_CANSA|nr:hypothetical protein F8388_004916 [Cannabis sativa]